MNLRIINLNQIDTHDKIVFWIRHVSKFSFVDSDMIGRLIDIACEKNNLPMPPKILW